jgi:lipopolysaccharide transport system ATP-binding protein
MKPAITFNEISKYFTLRPSYIRGFKGFILNFPRSLKSIGSTRFVALKDVSFDVAKGETFGIIGNNGAGKSTTLSIIAGIIEPSSGSVTVDGRPSPLIELGAGFHPELTGRENIFLNGVLLGLTIAEVRRKLGEIIEFSELGDFVDQPIRVFSSGMVARLGFSVVACLEPEILLVDEVLAVGDMEFQKKCLDKMREFKREGVTIIIVSHDLEDIRALCDRVMWIDEHRMRMIGPADEVIRSYEAVYSNGEIKN